MPRYTTAGGYPNTDPYSGNSEEIAKIEAEADRQQIRAAAIEDCVSVITATWGADLLTTVRHLRALKDRDYDEWVASDPLGNPSVHP